jgi:hypothetical protein
VSITPGHLPVMHKRTTFQVTKTTNQKKKEILK